MLGSRSRAKVTEEVSDNASTGTPGGRRRNGMARVDSAGFAGVPRSTVGKVLNGYPNISETTRERVPTEIRRHQY